MDEKLKIICLIQMFNKETERNHNCSEQGFVFSCRYILQFCVHFQLGKVISKAQIQYEYQFL